MTPVDEIVWISEETPAYNPGPMSGCAPVAAEARLPVGLRGVAKPIEACGSDWMYVRFQVPGFKPKREMAWYVPASALTKKPPRVNADAAPSIGKAFVRGAGDEPTFGLFVDDPAWTTPALLTPGEPVDVLAPGVVRTNVGREVAVDLFYVVTEDPLLKTYSEGARYSVPLRRRLHAGRPAHEKAAPLAPLPAADALARAPKGQPFAFVLDPKWLTDPVFQAEWFDPVGHTLDHACGDKPRAMEPCGRYLLDYTPFGAWLPDRETEVIAVWDGKRLVVQVIDPWGESIAVSPAWDAP